MLCDRVLTLPFLSESQSRTVIVPSSTPLHPNAPLQLLPESASSATLALDMPLPACLAHTLTEKCF